MNIIKHLLLFLLVILPLQLIGALLIIPSCILQEPTALIPLPKFLKWFDNADQYVGRNTQTYMAVYASGKWARYCWLAWRNPLNYFGYTILGIEIDQSLKVLDDSPKDIDIGDTTHSGTYTGLISLGNKQYWELYKIIPYSLFGNKLCLRIRLGWKLEHTSDLKVGQRCEWVFVISPFHAYTGE